MSKLEMIDRLRAAGNNIAYVGGQKNSLHISRADQKRLMEMEYELRVITRRIEADYDPKKLTK